MKYGWILLAALLCAAGPATTDAATSYSRERSENLEQRFRILFDKLNVEFSEKLQVLAQWCAEQGLNEKATEVWQQAQELNAELQGAAPRGEAAEPDEAKVRAFEQKRGELNKSHAIGLYSLGKKCYESGLVGRSYDMVWEMIRYDPDNATARKLLGQVKYEDEWIGRYDAMLRKRGMVFTDTYGWVPKRHLERLEEGYLPHNGRWTPAEEVEKIRSSWANAWEYETEHFTIRTNTKLAEAVAFGKVVEENYDLFMRVWVSYFSPKNQSTMLFGLSGSTDKMKVNYFATQEEYVKATGMGQGTAGVYMSRPGASYFFKTNLAQNIHVLKHETTHQMFSETKRARYGSKNGAWLVEAVAAYMETCHRRDGRIETAGKSSHWVRRFASILKGNGAVPLATFDILDYEQFQKVAQVAYPQAASLAHFCMEAEDGKYRERFVEYVRAYYEGKLRSGKGEMERYLGEPYDVLEHDSCVYVIGEDGLKELEELRKKQAEEARRKQEEALKKQEENRPALRR